MFYNNFGLHRGNNNSRCFLILAMFGKLMFFYTKIFLRDLGTRAGTIDRGRRLFQLKKGGEVFFVQKKIGGEEIFLQKRKDFFN